MKRKADGFGKDTETEIEKARAEKRRMAVEAVRNGDPVSVVARVMGVPHRTVFSWLARYRAGGHDALKEGHRAGRPRKVNEVMMGWLYQAITGGDPRQHQLPFCLWTLGLVRQVLWERYQVRLSKSGVSRLLAHLGLSPQRPIYRNYKQDPVEMKRYLDKRFPGLRAKAKRLGAVIFFVDEAGVRSDAHQGTTWGKIGETPVVEDSGDRFGIRLISAVSARGDMRFSSFEGRMNAARFIDFIKKLRQDVGRPIIVIADNASYHTAKAVKKYAQASGGEVAIATLPKYAPELNPDEQVWNHAKSRLSKLFVATKEEFKSAIHGILLSIQQTAGLVQTFFKLPDTLYASET